MLQAVNKCYVKWIRRHIREKRVKYYGIERLVPSATHMNDLFFSHACRSDSMCLHVAIYVTCGEPHASIMSHHKAAIDVTRSKMTSKVHHSSLPT